MSEPHPLARLESVLGVRMSAEYWNGLVADARVVLPGPRPGHEVWLYAVPDLAGINEAAELPGLVIIGTEGGREAIALDGRADPPPVVIVDVVFAGWDDAIWQAPDLATFLRGYPVTGLRWS
jgi:hypothetical protein